MPVINIHTLEGTINSLEAFNSEGVCLRDANIEGFRDVIGSQQKYDAEMQRVVELFESGRTKFSMFGDCGEVRMQMHGSWDHVQILSQGEGGFFGDAGYLEIEDHANEPWSPSTAMSEVACAQNTLAKKLASAAEAAAATAAAEAAQRRQEAARVVPQRQQQVQQQVQQRQQQVQQRQQAAEAGTRKQEVDKSSSKRTAEVATLQIAPPKMPRYHHVSHLSLEERRLRHNAQALESYHNMKRGDAGRSRAAPKPPPACLTPKEVPFWVRTQLFLAYSA
jgi:DNA segregation ATPase FtsK/SpoIIIE-like protein